MVSLVVASVIWSFMLEDPAGVINSLIGWLGIPPQPWLGSTRLALTSVILVTLWQSVGYSMIIFLAGLQDIPAVYYEAARIDGAGGCVVIEPVTSAQAGRPGDRARSARRGRRGADRLVLLVSAALYFVVRAGQLLWMLSSSLKGPGEVLASPPTLFPPEVRWHN